MFTVDLNDGQWLQCMCTQILNAFTINKVGMYADVVVANGGTSCDVDGRILVHFEQILWLHYSLTWDVGWGQMGVQFAVTRGVAVYGVCAEFIS